MTVSERADLDTMAASISERIRALPRHDAATLRALRRVVSKEVAAAPARESDGSQSDVLGASELAVRDADSVAAFLQRHRGRLAPRVLREVRNKLASGRKAQARTVWCAVTTDIGCRDRRRRPSAARSMPDAPLAVRVRRLWGGCYRIGCQRPELGIDPPRVGRPASVPPASAMATTGSRRQLARTTRVMRRIALITLAGACATEPAATGVDDADAVATLTIVEQLRIGSVSDPDVGFTRVDEVDVDSDGQIFVFETRPPEIRVYSASGELVRRIGRQGRGPGELQGPRFSFGVRSDTVWVIDPFARRITLFDRTGRLLSTGTIQDARMEWGSGETVALVPFEMEPQGLFVSSTPLVGGTGRSPPATRIC